MTDDLPELEDLAPYEDRHEAIRQPGCNVCVCGELVDDATAHWVTS